MPRTGPWKGWGWLAAGGVIAAISTACAWAAGGRLEFDVREPYQIGAQVYPAGALRMKTVHDFTPSTKIQEVWAGERCLGMMFARRAHAETALTKSAAVFRRSPQGHLVLLGYTVADEDDGAVYRLTPNGGGRQRTAADFGADELVIVASR